MDTIAAPTLAPGAEYFPFPYSIDPLSEELEIGLIPIGVFALLSMLATFSVLAFIIYHMVLSRQHRTRSLGRNQFVVLIVNLLLADFQQSIGFVLSFHWLHVKQIVAPSSACFVQGWFVQLGDIGNGFFVLAVGIHTYLAVVRGYQLPNKWFIAAVIFIWGISILLAILGPATHAKNYFVRAGAWCWVSEAFEAERLWYQYFWIFISQFGTLILYLFVFLNLQKRIPTILRSDKSKTPSRIKKASLYMVAYPLMYVLLTLPLAIGRMYRMATGRNMSDSFFCVVGCLMTSCGWVDALLYTLTRRVLVNGVNPASSNPSRNGASNPAAFPRHLGPEHNVVITGGHRHSVASSAAAPSRERSSLPSTDWGRTDQMGHPHAVRKTRPRRSDSISLGDISPTESMDPIVKPMGLNEVKTETRVEVRIESRANVRKSEDSLSIKLPDKPTGDGWP